MEQKGVLILATQRCAGTNISKGIASYYDKKYIHEPNLFNIQWTTDDVVKLISNKYSFPKYVSKFKNIILITRRDLTSAKESLGFLYYVKHNFDQTWNSNKVEIVKKSKEYKSAAARLDYCTKCINFLSKELDIPIEYTEDVLINKKFNYSDIKIDPAYLEPNLKLRTTWNETAI